MTMEEIARVANLELAFGQVAKNQGAPGPDGQRIEAVAADLDRLLARLSRQLLDGSYAPGRVRRKWIPKPGGGERGLGVPNVIDRIAQQAVHQVLSPHFDRTFHASSHGFRPGRSCHTAIAEAGEHLREGYEWVVDLDLAEFFDRVNHQRLLARLRQEVADERVVRLIGRMLKAEVVLPDGVVVSTAEGTPQGGPLSPQLSNIVLDELDQELARRGHRFVRYADDCNIYVRSERAGERVMASISRFIERRLRLEVNRDKSAVARPETRHFLGFQLRWDEEAGQVEVSLSERTVKRFRARLRELIPRNWGQSLRACIRRLGEYLAGWMGYFRVCTAGAERLLKTLDGKIRRRLRAVVLRHWRRRSTIAEQLIRLGARPWKVYRMVWDHRAQWWEMSGSHPVNQALRNRCFAMQGHVTLHQRWQAWQLRPIVRPPEQLWLLKRQA